MERDTQTNRTEQRSEQVKYTVVIENSPTSYGAYVPDIPGCVAVADTKEEVRNLIREAIQLYTEVLEEEGLPLPTPQSYELIEI